MLPFLLNLLVNKWTFVVLSLATLGAWGEINKLRLESTKVKLERLQADFDQFKANTQATADAAQKAANDAAAAHQRLIAQKESENVAAQDAIRRRYDSFIAGLRQPAPGGSGSDQLPGAAPAPTICHDPAADQRLSDALQRFEIGTAQLLESAERQTRALTTLQQAWPR